MGSATVEEEATATVLVAVVVTYNPDLSELNRLLDALRNEVTAVVIVDNGSATDLSVDLSGRNESREHLIQLGVNLGVAEGQNRGVEWARNRGAHFVILFDQDSLPEKGMISRLLTFAVSKTHAGEPLGAVGPTNIDARWNKALPFVKVKGWSYERITYKLDESFVEVDHIISSGALIPIESLDRVGGMRSEFFIDYIDIEWCLRAKASGFPIYGLREARMFHSLGDSIVDVWGMKLSMHSPYRDYYLFRNAVWMMRQGWVDIAWKLAEAKRLATRFVLYAVFGKPRLKQIRLMSLGLLDGIRSVDGPVRHRI